MAKRKALNKSSTYIESFVDFILDTKPYHSKLTQVIEEYHFSDNMHVHFDERFINRSKLDSTWMYNFYSSASAFQRTMPIQRVVNPSFQAMSYKVGRDEDKDMAKVPFVYSKKAFDNIGIHTAFIHRERGTLEPLTESVDYFTSHGAFQFQVKQTIDASGKFVPLWTSSNDEGVIAHATAATKRRALDETNPKSPLNQLRALMSEISATYFAEADVAAEVVKIRDILDIPSLPQTYEDLFAAMEAHTDIPFDIASAKKLVQNLSSPLFFNLYSDIGMRESGLASYRAAENESIRIYDIEPSHEFSAYEEWTIDVYDKDTKTWRVTGSVSGMIGLVEAGKEFTTNPKIKFKTESKRTPEDGEKVVIRPTRKLVIHKDAPLETWNLIKVNAMAHSRATYRSSHYGLIKDTKGEYGNITIVDQTMPTTTIILDARADGVHFDIINTEFPQHQGVVTADVPYNDGYVAFTIVTGAAPFQLGDRYVIQIINIKARASTFELGFGYDLDAYDNDHLVYNNTDPASPDYNKKIGFYYDSRFNDYDVSLLNLEIHESAVNNRRFRLRALPSNRPIATIKRNGTGPNNWVDLHDATSGTPPDPSLTGIPVYSMQDDANPDPDLMLYYASEFALEYSDDGFNTIHFVQTLPVGASFSSEALGIKFDFRAGSKPFISASSDNGPGQPRVIGGDVFTFIIDNPVPYVANRPILFISPSLPRLIMHSDSFYDVPGGKWEVNVKSPTTYTVTGYNNSGDLIGTANGTLLTPGAGPVEGNSFKGLGVHFTFVPNKGGIFAGDVFKFDTYDRKPSYLVHGSVTGFTEPAVIGEFYWNGKIGFTITKPEWVLYVDGREQNAAEKGFKLLRLRDDTPSMSYVIDKTTNGYMVSRSDIGIQKFMPATGRYEDKYVTFELTNGDEQNYLLDINANDFPLFHGHDTVIIKSAESPMPVAGDHVIIEKTRQDRLGISITSTRSSLIPLKPITIDSRLIDLDTRNAVYPLSLTSPDAVILNGWLPTYMTKLDSVSSIAEFSDPVVRYEVMSAANGARIGVVKQQTANVNEPIIFEWDNEFYKTYLPLNAEANITTTGSGWNDLTKVNITESVKFLIDGGALVENFLFQEVINAKITGAHEFKIDVNYQDSFAAVLEDSNFEGFLRGYGNVGFDGTTYDEGRAPDLYSVLANVNITPEQRENYLKQWSFYLKSNVLPTTEDQWAYVRQMFGLDPNPGYDTTDDFGFPARGVGFDVTDTSGDTAGPSFQEAFVTVIREQANPYDMNVYDYGKLDQQSDEIVVMLSSSLPPVPFEMPAGVTYDALQTPLSTALPARNFEIMFTGSKAQLAALAPVFRIWVQGEPEPQLVPQTVVEKLAAGKYRFTIPQASEAKIIVG